MRHNTAYAAEAHTSACVRLQIVQRGGKPCMSLAAYTLNMCDLVQLTKSRLLTNLARLGDTIVRRTDIYFEVRSSIRSMRSKEK